MCDVSMDNDSFRNKKKPTEGTPHHFHVVGNDKKDLSFTGNNSPNMGHRSHKITPKVIGVNEIMVKTGEGAPELTGKTEDKWKNLLKSTEKMEKEISLLSADPSRSRSWIEEQLFDKPLGEAIIPNDDPGDPDSKYKIRIDIQDLNGVMQELKSMLNAENPDPNYKVDVYVSLTILDHLKNELKKMEPLDMLYQ